MIKICTLLTGILLCSFSVLAQCANTFYTLSEGTASEMTIYNKKDKVEGKVVNTITAVVGQDGARKATMHSKIFDRKDELLSEGNYDIICEGDNIKIDTKQMFASMSQLSAYENTDMQIAGEYIIIPSQLQVGALLPECKSNMTLRMGENALTVTSTDLYLKNRRVEKKEDITTPAGTFACYKITYDMDIEMKIMGINRNISSKGAEWIAEGVGVVKTATYDKKGEVESYSLLTSQQ